MITAAMMYARIPLPPAKQNRIQRSLTTVGSTPRYSPIPPQIPPSQRSLERTNLFSSIILFSLMVQHSFSLKDRMLMKNLTDEIISFRQDEQDSMRGVG